MYGEWLREELEGGYISQAKYDPDMAILLWQARHYSLPLKGSDCVNVTAPIPMADIQKAISLTLPELIKSVKGDERNVLLTLARMWYTASTGEICSKDIAADWAFQRLPENFALLLDLARKAYLGEINDCWKDSEAEILSLVAYINQSITNLLSHRIEENK